MDITTDPAVAADARARTVEAAALILREEFGLLTVGDLVSGLKSAAVQIRAKHAKDGPVIKPLAADPEHPHGYHEAGDYP
jgi:hypothetical protein